MDHPDERAGLRADCVRCTGLCCVVPAFARSADFAFAKPAGQACRHLGPDFRCGIHASLRREGMPGCAVFDCFGAGQRTVELGGDPAVFTTLRQLQELRWYLVEAAGLAGGPLLAEVTAEREVVARLAGSDAATLATLDTGVHGARVGALLGRVSAAVRDGLAGRDLRDADLVGRRMAGADLRGASLRGAYLIGTDLHGADLRSADLLGTDLRGTDVRGADLSTALFVTQPQLDAATGDATTGIPPFLARPRHWS